MKYPVFKELPDVEDFHGTAVADPFKWLEEPDNEDTKAWFEYFYHFFNNFHFFANFFVL
jgi:hypothetical protein